MGKIRIGRLTPLAIILLSALKIAAISPELTIPRIGDTFQVAKLHNAPAFVDSARMNPNLVDASVDSYMKFAVWEPSPLDSVATAVMVIGKDITSLKLAGDTLWQISKHSPGISRYYDTLPTFNIPREGMVSQHVKSHGNRDNIGDYSTSGSQTSTLIKDLLLITENGDTLNNVECSLQVTTDTLMFDGAKSTYFSKSTLKKWFAPGYRYPLLFHEQASILSTDYELIDSVSTWYVISDRLQEHELAPDPENEELRNQLLLSRNSGKNPLSKKKNSYSYGPEHEFDYNPENKTITVALPDYNDEEFNFSYEIWSISGVEYYSRSMTNARRSMPKNGFTVDLKKLPPGQYVIKICRYSQEYTYKFLIQ